MEETQMPKLRVITLVFAVVVISAVTMLRAQKANPPAAGDKAKHAPAAKHVALNADEMKWGPAPPGLPAGAEAIVLNGDPGKTGTFIVRAKLPDGYRVPPHSHPTDENVTVLSGSLAMGMGDTADEASMKALGPNGFAHVPKLSHHYVTAKGETVIQIQAMGPFAITYVNPNDDPRKKPATPKK
jgi:quercetin dioxygenase-like cupin family protein